jgi:quercetin dioxygenase-like cupin family protein
MERATPQGEISFPLSPVDANSFTGVAQSGLLAGSGGSPPTRVYYVRFEPTARTHWHTHSGTQILLVQEGVCLLQLEGEPLETHEAGAVVRIAPGIRHWHGASSEGAMVHVALNLDTEHTEWLDPVTDEVYGGER